MRRRWKAATIVLLLVGLILVSCSVRAGGGDAMNLQLSVEIEWGSLDVSGTAVTYVGNLGSSPSAAVGASMRNVLLLHGAKFSAQTWQDLGTIELLVKKGYRVAAVDLPTRLGSPSRDVLLGLICAGLGMGEDNPAVIVSPSMSGSFSVPLLLSSPSLFAGYVPIAPGIAGTYGRADFESVIGVPALIVYGERDPMGTRVSKLLSAIPDSRLVMVTGASHPAYLDEPQVFHDLLQEFLEDDVFRDKVT